LSALTSGLALILIAVFFVTSADSGSLVLDMLASGGNDSTPAYQRVFWCALEAAVASILLVAGGLTALQTATIASALPFAVVIILLCFGLWRGLSADLAGQVLVRQQRGRTRIAGAGAAPWRRRLATLVLPPTKGEVQHYLVDTARPALEQVASELSNGVAGAEVREADDGYALVLPSEQARDFIYGVRLASAKLPAFVLTGVGERSASERRVWLALTHFTDGRRGYNVMGYSRDQLINDVIDQYEIYRLMLRSPQSELFITSPDRTPERPSQMDADDDA
ncbi:MAG TPA: BCCT family transporter, partial [Thermomicrobiales bacterium]|nr:BCCT family transporter [Thermomicrobiales bacterium]